MIEPQSQAAKKSPSPIIIFGGAFIALCIALAIYGTIKSPEKVFPVAPLAAAAANSSVIGGIPSPSAAPHQTSMEKQPNADAWEPVGKYSKEEIATVSDFVGILFRHLRATDAIEDRVSLKLRAGYRDVDTTAMMSAMTNYSMDATEEKEGIDKISIPEIDNQQAYDLLLSALKGLQDIGAIQEKRSSVLMESIQPGVDAKAVAERLKELKVQMSASSVRLVSAYGAYLSYGFTTAMIDEKSSKLRRGAKPDRPSAGIANATTR
jgi:hypothetical protein